MSVERCGVELRRGDTWHSRWEPCGKPAKGALRNGQPACGVHLRSEKAEIERAARRAAWEARKTAVNEALGIQCFGWDIDRAVMVDLKDLEQLVQRLHKGTAV